MVFRVFVTVGSTRFDGLVGAVLSANKMWSLGCSELVIQHGNSCLEEQPYFAMLETIDQLHLKAKCKSPFPRLIAFDFLPNIANFIKSATVIICHAGAGTLLEAMRISQARIICVANNSLMHDHQTELAKQLYLDNHVVFASTPHSAVEYLLDLLRTPQSDWPVRCEFPGQDPRAFVAMFEQFWRN